MRLGILSFYFKMYLIFSNLHLHYTPIAPLKGNSSVLKYEPTGNHNHEDISNNKTETHKPVA